MFKLKVSKLEGLKNEMEHIAGEWNGDEPGIQEENSKVALEVIDKINEIKELLEQLR